MRKAPLLAPDRTHQDPKELHVAPGCDKHLQTWSKHPQTRFPSPTFSSSPDSSHSFHLPRAEPGVRCWMEAGQLGDLDDRVSAHSPLLPPCPCEGTRCHGYSPPRGTRLPGRRPELLGSCILSCLGKTLLTGELSEGRGRRKNKGERRFQKNRKG